MKEGNIPILKWLLGKIISVNPDYEGSVRNVTVETFTGICNRAVNNIIRLLEPGKLLTTDFILQKI